jgi:hypothetical protein
LVHKASRARTISLDPFLKPACAIAGAFHLHLPICICEVIRPVTCCIAARGMIHGLDAGICVSAERD